MIADALLAYLHFISVFMLFAFLSIEVILLSRPLDANAIGRLASVDLWYGLSSAFVLLAGIGRVLWGAKGVSFYTSNPVFWAKMGFFALVGILSIPPTLKFFRWSRALIAEPSFVPDETARRSMRRYVMIELHLAALIPMLAVLMARGIGH